MTLYVSVGFLLVGNYVSVELRQLMEVAATSAYFPNFSSHVKKKCIWSSKRAREAYRVTGASKISTGTIHHIWSGSSATLLI